MQFKHIYKNKYLINYEEITKGRGILRVIFDIVLVRRPEKRIKLTEDSNHVTPWASRKTLQIKSPQLRMHNEIVEFYLYISPTEEEH